MTLNVFIESLKYNAPPSDITPELQALWYDAKGNWDIAHQIVQNNSSSESAWVHAYLHRKELDIYNASYWYRIAGKPMPEISYQKEWEEISQALLLSLKSI